MESMKLDCLGDKNRMISTGICESDQFLVRISWKMYGFLTVSGRISASKPQNFRLRRFLARFCLFGQDFRKSSLVGQDLRTPPHPSVAILTLGWPLIFWMTNLDDHFSFFGWPLIFWMTNLDDHFVFLDENSGSGWPIWMTILLISGWPLIFWMTKFWMTRMTKISKRLFLANWLCDVEPNQNNCYQMELEHF